MIAFCLLLPVFIYSTELFKWLGEDEEVSEIAGTYIISILPGIIVYGLIDIDRQFMTTFGVNIIAFQC